MSQNDKKRRIKLIANPGAGSPSNFTKNLQIAVCHLQEGGLFVDVALASPKKEAIPITQKAVKEGYETVAVMGGDGTIETVMRAILDVKTELGSKVHLGILPTGTANNIAKSVNIPLDLKEACGLITKDNIRKLDVGYVKTKKHQKFYFFELVAIGLTAALYPDAKEIPEGKLSSIKNVVNTLIQHESSPKVVLKMDDDSKITVNTLLVTVSNTPMFGLNFLVAPDASVQDGLLNISIYPNFNKADLLAYYAEVMNEGYHEDGQIQRYRAHELKIKSSPKLSVMADGVMLGKTKVRIKIRPKALRVIVPKKNAGVARLSDVTNGEQVIPLPLPVNEAVTK